MQYARKKCLFCIANVHQNVWKKDSTTHSKRYKTYSPRGCFPQWLSTAEKYIVWKKAIALNYKMITTYQSHTAVLLIEFLLYLLSSGVMVSNWLYQRNLMFLVLCARIKQFRISIFQVITYKQFPRYYLQDAYKIKTIGPNIDFSNNRVEIKEYVLEKSEWRREE
jgi:hypothetical protein